MVYIYAIYSKKTKRIYVGQTENIERRLKEHNNGLTKSIKFYIPWNLFYYEKTKDRKEARKKELYYKSGCGKEKLRVILKEFLSRPHS